MSPQVQWELACLRCRYRGLSGKPWRCHREQARSHNVAESPVGAGLPAMQAQGAVRKTVVIPSRASPLPQCRRKSSGSWLACDAGTGGCQANRGDAIASKPAPTMSPQVQWELACLRCRYRGLSGKPWRCHREQARSHNVAESPVGAGLPAMQAQGAVSKTVVIPSRASPLPQGGYRLSRIDKSTAFTSLVIAPMEM